MNAIRAHHLLPLKTFQPCPNERQPHHVAATAAAAEDPYSREVPALLGGVRNHIASPGYHAGNVKRLLSAYRWGQSGWAVHLEGTFAEDCSALFH